MEQEKLLPCICGSEMELLTFPAESVFTVLHKGTPCEYFKPTIFSSKALAIADWNSKMVAISDLKKEAVVVAPSQPGKTADKAPRGSKRPEPASGERPDRPGRWLFQWAKGRRVVFWVQGIERRSGEELYIVDSDTAEDTPPLPLPVPDLTRIQGGEDAIGSWVERLGDLPDNPPS